jgi:hypothetical protein
MRWFLILRDNVPAHVLECVHDVRFGIRICEIGATKSGISRRGAELGHRAV